MAKKSKYVIIILLCLVLFSAIGSGYFYYSNNKMPDTLEDYAKLKINDEKYKKVNCNEFLRIKLNNHQEKNESIIVKEYELKNKMKFKFCKNEIDIQYARYCAKYFTVVYDILDNYELAFLNNYDKEVFICYPLSTKVFSHYKTKYSIDNFNLYIENNKLNINDIGTVHLDQSYFVDIYYLLVKTPKEGTFYIYSQNYNELTGLMNKIKEQNNLK